MNDNNQMSEALDLIYDEAEKLMVMEGIPEAAEQSIERIVALSRYKFDVVGKETDK